MDETRPGPVSGVSICVIHDGKVLLARRGNPAGFGLWSFPGGHVRHGEPLRAAALRELREETGIEAEIIKLLDTIDIIHRDPSGEIEAHFILSVFAGRWTGGTAKAASDARAVRWVTPDELTGLKMTPGTDELALAALRQIT